MAFHANGFTRIAAAFCDGPVKYPGVAAQQGALLAFSESNYFHAAIVTPALIVIARCDSPENNSQARIV